MSDKLSTTGDQFIAETLKKNGVTHVFYQELAFYFTTKILEKYGIKHILTHSEGAAGYMADGYARASKKPGICMSQAIGSANLAASIHDAWLGTSPVIALTGFKCNSALQKNGYQDSDHRAHFSGVTKYNEQTLNPQQLPHLLRQCFREVTTGQPRPAHLDVIGYAGEMAEKSVMEDIAQTSDDYGQYPSVRFAGDEQLVLQAAKEIDASEKPVIVAGRGARISDDGSELYKLATKADIPVLTTPDGKTIIDETDDIWAGVVGGYGMDCANKTASASDLVIYIGSMISDQTTLAYTAPSKNTRIIQIDIEGTELGKNYPNTLGIMGDAATVMKQLSNAVSNKKRNSWRKEVKAFVADTLKKQDEKSRIDGPIIETARLCRDLSDSLPDNAIVVADTGWSATWGATWLRMKPSQLFMRAAGSLGWAYPASLGAKCASPDRPVICYAGDGAFYYHLVEMETAMRYNIDTVTVINNNSRINQCIPYVGEAYTGQADVYEKYKQKVTFNPGSFADIASCFGINSIKVEKASDIKPAIQSAIDSKKPSLVEVITDKGSAPLPALE